jgi:DNA-directed RNA polymerase specialized sigma24 family protein
MKLDKNELVEYFYENRKLFTRSIARYGLDPGDIIHDCVLRILESRTDVYELYNGQRINYLRRLVKNCCITQLKREQRYTDLNGLDISDEEVNYPDMLNAVNGSHLSDIKKKIILGHFWRDLTYKQLGEEMNVSDGTLKSIFCRNKDEFKILFR